MNRLPTILATMAALSIILVIACTEAKVPTTGSEVSKSFSALAQLFSADQPDLEAQASTADDFVAKNPEALAFARERAKNGEESERAAAATVLARINNPAAVEELCDMIEDDSKLARGQVYAALQRQNTPEARKGLTRAFEIYGVEDGLAEVICEVMDEEMWAVMSGSFIPDIEGLEHFEGQEQLQHFKLNFDAEAVKLMIMQAKGHEAEIEFDQEEFALHMKELGRALKEKFGDREEMIEIKVKVDKDKHDPSKD